MAQKKTFLQDIENPAELFISKPAEAPAPAQTEEAPAGKAPEGYHANPLFIENKSKRLQLLTRLQRGLSGEKNTMIGRSVRKLKVALVIIH